MTYCLATPRPRVNQCRLSVNKSQRNLYQYIFSKNSLDDNDEHYSDIIISAMAFEITVVSIVCSTFFQQQIKENIKAPRHWLCEGNPPVTDGFPLQKASNAENVSIR